VKTENPSACVTVNCKACISAIPLYLSVVPSGVYKVSINPIIQSKIRLQFTHTSLFMTICLSVALQPLWAYTQAVGLFGRGISPSQGRYLHTEQHKDRINAHRRACLEWDSNPRSQFSSGRRRFMP
jgi:hypothetical protein